MSISFDGQRSLSRLYSDETPKPVNTPKRSLPSVSVAQVAEPVFENSADQNRAKEKIAEFLLGRDTCISLIGPAGSGKTTILKQILADAKRRKWKVALSAPTHQAAARIREATKYHADTTHRLLGVSLVRDEKTGDEYLKAKGTPDIQPGTLLVVDESSMLQSKLKDIILRFAEKHDCKVIFVGDAAQLSPVKEAPSPTVAKDSCEWEIIELTTIHRQAAENPIIALATSIREAQRLDTGLFKTFLRDGKGVEYFEDRKLWADYLVQQCGMEDFQHKYIAYTNRATDEAAKAIRQNRYGNDAIAHPYLIGEELVVNSRCVPNDSSGKSRRGKKRKDQVVIPSNENVTVKNVFRDGELFKVECDWNGHHVLLDALSGYKAREKHLDSLKQWAIKHRSWKQFFDTSDSIADLRSACSMTAHSSQGSTFDNVFINLTNMAICRNPDELRRLLYVAVTRATGTVYVCGELR